jgi:hypothetical protein
MTLIHALGRVPDRGRSEGPNLAKALVMAELTRIVAQGDAVTAMLESGAARASPCDWRNLPSWRGNGHACRLTIEAIIAPT